MRTPDLEQSGALAPGANVIDYQAPNTDPGFADAFFTVASQNTADTVSTSWSESETLLESLILAGQEAATYNAAFDEAFLELAAQGQSAFDASGDSGAYAASRDLGTTNLSVGTNPDSPYITATGGTTLPSPPRRPVRTVAPRVTVPAQRIWGWDYLWPPIAKITGVPELRSRRRTSAAAAAASAWWSRIPRYQEFVPGTTASTPCRT